jgi:hypothetical protein
MQAKPPSSTGSLPLLDEGTGHKNRDQKDGLASSTPEFFTKVRRGMVRKSMIRYGRPKRIKATFFNVHTCLAKHHV